LAVNEAAANVILHAYERAPGKPLEMVINRDDDGVRVALYHEGKDFDPTEVAPPRLDGSQSSGFGLHLIRQSIDDVQYFRDDRGRRGIVLFKRLAQGDPMQSLAEKVGDITIVTPNMKHLDASNADEFRMDMNEALQGTRNLVLDLNKVEFIDSRGCGAILSCLKHLSTSGGDLKLCNISRPVRTTLEIIRLHRICEIHDSRDAAVKSFG
jgi:anti-sigma B factor antagonist